jgi:hypothetical protein
MKEKLAKPKETICLLLYEKPLNVEEICKIMYGKRNSRVPTWLKELWKKKWIKPIVKQGYHDTRFHYYQTTPKWIHDKISAELKRKKIQLTPDEKLRLQHFLNTKHMKKFLIDVINHVDFKERFEGFSFIRSQLCYLWAFHSFFWKSGAVKESDIYSLAKTMLYEPPYNGQDELKKILIDFIDDDFMTQFSKEETTQLNTKDIDKLREVYLEQVFQNRLSRDEEEKIKNAVRDELIDVYCYRHLDEIMAQIPEEKEEGLYTELTLLSIPLLDKLANLDVYTTQILRSYLSRLMSDGWSLLG